MSNPEDSSKANVTNAAQEIDYLDYLETPDITRVHAAIQREQREPLTASVPIPLWLMTFFGLVLCWGSYYLGTYSGGFHGDVFNERAGAGAEGSRKAAAGGAATQAAESPVEMGKKVFANCAACHQATGLGMASSGYPPLVQSEFVLGSPKRLAMIVLKGLQGPVQVKGVTYSIAAMPPWEKALTDKQIAAVLTYIRQEWGNKAEPIAPEQIATARKEFKDRTESWTAADILAVPADAKLEGAAPAPSPGAPEPKQ